MKEALTEEADIRSIQETLQGIADMKSTDCRVNAGRRRSRSTRAARSPRRHRTRRVEARRGPPLDCSCGRAPPVRGSVAKGSRHAPCRRGLFPESIYLDV